MLFKCNNCKISFMKSQCTLLHLNCLLTQHPDVLHISIYLSIIIARLWRRKNHFIFRENILSLLQYTVKPRNYSSPKIVNELVLFYQIPSLNSNEGISNTAHRAHTTNFPLSHTFSSSYKNTRLMISEKKNSFAIGKIEKKSRGRRKKKIHTSEWKKQAIELWHGYSVEFKCFLRQLLKRFIRARSEILEFLWLLVGGVLNLDLIVLSWNKIS